MSYLDTKQALITQLLTVVDSTDVTFENKYFDPKTKPFYFAASFHPATSEALGKTLASSKEDRGFFQVSVFVTADTIESDNVQLEKIDLIASAFNESTSIEYNGQTVDILDSTLNTGTENESWYKRDLTINYLTFSNRN